MKQIEKKQKVLVASKSIRCDVQIAKVWLRQHRGSQSLRMESEA